MAVLRLFDYSAGYSSAFSDVSVENLVKKKRRNTFRELLKLVKVVATLRLIIRVVGYFKIEKKFSLQLFPLRELLRIANLRAAFC